MLRARVGSFSRTQKADRFMKYCGVPGSFHIPASYGLSRASGPGAARCSFQFTEMS